MRSVAVLPSLFLLVSCGGGGGDGTPAAALATSNSVTVSAGSGGSTSAAPSSQLSPPAVAFAASTTNAPAPSATVFGIVRIDVAGSGIKNLELLPSVGSAPLYARGTVAVDGSSGFIEFNTASVPDGLLSVRVAAFNQPPGSGGSEITAMSARTWTIRNTSSTTGPCFLVPSTIPIVVGHDVGSVANTCASVTGASSDTFNTTTGTTSDSKAGSAAVGVGITTPG